jgi:hypothetical protein
MNTKNYVVCRPEGGLNDILCRIMQCYIYSQRHNRTLLVDTCSTGFGECLSKYFKLNSNIEGFLFCQSSNLNEFIEPNASIYPDLDLNEYEKTFSPNLNYIDKKTQKSLSFDFNKNYSQQVLLHHACGGGQLSHYFFSIATLQVWLANLIQEKIKSVNSGYIGTHIRSTDLKTNFKSKLYCLKESLSDELLYVATDNLHVLLFAKQLFGEDKVLNFSNSISSNGNPNHEYQEKNKNSYNRDAINTETITDLILLSAAKKLYIHETESGFFSGFSILAKYLHDNKLSSTILGFNS